MIKFIKSKKLFILQTKHSSYVFGLNDKNVPIFVYYGEKLEHSEELNVDFLVDSQRFEQYSSGYIYPQEYVTHTLGVYDEESLKVRFSDGVSDLDLTFESYETTDDVLIVWLKDRSYKIKVGLVYRVYEKIDLISRCVVIKNDEDDLIIENVQSANLYFPVGEDYRLTYFSGKWAGEFQKKSISCNTGKFVLETRRGTCSGPHFVPFFAIDNEKNYATETQGEVWFGALHCSGNFKIVAEKNEMGLTKIVGGTNFFDTSLHLKNGEQYKSCVFTFGYSRNGFGRMSESLYDFQYDYLCPQNKIHNDFPVLYNSWYPYEFDIDEEKLLKLADIAKEVGIELFVIDDGWMQGRKDVVSGLGDWLVDKKRFPNGFCVIERKVHDLGMKFGLWIEPEMVNIKSQLCESHPEWVLKYAKREQSLMRCQAVLNFALEEVYVFAENTVDRLIEEYKLDYIKWDMNRYIAETDCSSDFYLRYTENVLRLYQHVQTKYPNVLVECCAHGGARADFGTLAFSDRINRSDNSCPIDVLKLHDGFTTIFLPKLAGGAGNMPDSPHGMNGRESPLEYRARLGMTGSMSIGYNLLTASNEILLQTKHYVAEYKRLRNVLNNSYLYRLSSAFESKRVIWEYLSRDRKKAVIFVFAHGVNHWEQFPRVRLQGLLKDETYVIEGQSYSGEILMKYGLDIPVKGDYYSKIIELTAKTEC